MTREEMAAAIDGEIDRLERVRALLQHSHSEKFALNGKLVRSATAPSARAEKPPAGERPKRVLSPEARKRIALAQKRRWAKQKAAAK